MFDLQAFNEKRETAQAGFHRWDCSAEELKAAYAAGIRDFRYANLEDANLERANLEAANLGRANLEAANFRYANLERANLRRANLRDAHLERANLRDAHLRDANLLNTPGIYAAFGIGMSSRTDTLHGGVVLQNGSIELRFWAGCKVNITAAELRERVTKEHAGKPYEKQYLAAITFIETCFESDMQSKRWGYLLDWKPETEAAE